MSSRRISFAPVFLSSPLDKLSLSVEYEVAVRLSSEKLEAFSVGECLKALTSGEVWVARGNSCRVDFSITLDGKEIAQTNNDHIIELLGNFVTESKIWAQLGLSTTLHQQNLSLQTANISLHLDYDEPSSLPVVGSQPWSYTTTDIMTPEALLCAQIEQLKVCLAFRSTLTGNQTSKRVKTSQNSVISKDFTKRVTTTQPVKPKTSLIIKLGPSKKISMFLREFSDSAKLSKITSSDIAIKSSITKSGSREMSGLLQKCSDNLYSTIMLHAIPVFFQLSSFVSSGPFSTNFQSPVRTMAPNKRRKRREKSLIKLSNTETVTLEKNENGSVLLKDTATDEMLLLSGDEGTSIQTSVNDSPSSLTVKVPPRKRYASAFNHENEYILNPTASYKLVNAAMRIMIAGTETRQKTTKGLKIYNTTNTSATPLASLSPVMFSPGFKKSVADNSHYIPRIVRMLTSLARNAQTPSLRQKLAQIGSISTSEFSNDGVDAKINGERGSEKRLAAVVQARIWSMMQRTLYDPLAARQAMNKRSSPENAILADENDVYDDLLETIGTDTEMEYLKMVDNDFRWIVDEDPSEISAFDCILGDYDVAAGDEFDDLLEDEDEVVLLSDEERERLEIESGMEEMFFGRRWQLEDEEQYDDLLLVVESSNHDELLLDDRDGTTWKELSFGNDDMLLI